MPNRVFCDTQALIFWALQPRRLSRNGKSALESAIEGRYLGCSDIVLWEISMLCAKGRIHPGTDPESFLSDLIKSSMVDIFPITPSIAVLSQSSHFSHGDPADRLIAATAMEHQSPLITADEKLRQIPGLQVIW